MSTYRINSDQLRGTAGQIQGQSQQIMESIAKVMSQVADTRQFWEGTANSNFDALMSEWKITADRVQTTLDHTVTALNQAAGSYAETEQSNTARFAG